MLGELYRKAMRSALVSEDYKIGLKGIVVMISERAKPSEISRRYSWIALQIHAETA